MEKPNDFELDFQGRYGINRSLNESPEVQYQSTGPRKPLGGKKKYHNPKKFGVRLLGQLD
jgi:hypothetical protein